MGSAMDGMNDCVAQCRSADEIPGPEELDIVYHVADARDMRDLYPDKSFDVVFDKGCLDCFVTGDGEADIARYLHEVSRVLTPGGRALFVCVNGSDVAELLTSGGVVVREDPHCSKPQSVPKPSLNFRNLHPNI